RFGTPTEGYGSGTEKEFQDALACWGEQGEPWILFYFHDNPPLPKKSKDVEQYLKVCKFKEELETKGMVKGYSCVRGEKAGFYEQILRHLQQLVWQLTEDAQTDQKQSKSKQTKTITPTLPACYCAWLQKQCADIDLLGLRIEHGQAVRLNHVYVPLTTTASKEQIPDTTSPEETRGWREDKPPALLLQMLDEQSLYVSGAPGS
ncbi:MAG: hypothetical protein GY934_23845, partial [Gammaproteobacteria bacterium]|nr:hypothetical protein [Gammaproteobacteria bacterium]